MSATDTVLVVILTSLLSLFFILCIAVMIMVLKLISSIRTVVAKAEDVVDSVESAAEVFRDTQGKMAIIKVIGNIIKLAQRSRK